MDALRKFFDLFIKETKERQVLIVLLAFIGILLWDRNEITKLNTKQANERFVTDSIRVTRHDSAILHLESKMQECQETRLSDYKELTERWQKKYDELFKETDRLYQKINEN